MINTKMYFKMLSLYQSYFILNHSVRCSYCNRGKVTNCYFLKLILVLAMAQLFIGLFLEIGLM